MTLLAGQVPTAAEWALELKPGQVIARASRPTASTAASAAQGVLRLDNVSLISGRRYQIRTSQFTVVSSFANDRGTVRLSMDTTGAAATTASTAYSIANSPAIDNTTDGCDSRCEFNYTPGSNQTVSIILWTQRLAGTGNIRLTLLGNQTIDIEVVDCGVDIGDTGVDL